MPTRQELAILSLVVLLGMGVRLAFFPAPGFKGDMEFFARWANTLVSTPIGDFYARGAPECDNLPGYLYLLATTGWLKATLTGTVGTPESFALWIKAGAAVADVALALVIYCFCRRNLNLERSLLAAVLTLFSPSILFVSAVWGQVDSVSVAFTVGSLATLLSGRPIVASVLAGVAFAVKPQYSLALAVGGVAYLSRQVRELRSGKPTVTFLDWGRWLGRTVGAPAAVALTVLELALLPFSTSLWRWPGVGWSLSDRLSIAGSRFPVTSADAFNLWATSIAGVWKPDSGIGWLSVNYQSWGFILVAPVIGVGLWLGWRRDLDNFSVLWGCLVVALGFFVLPTRIHERYLFMAVPLAATLAAFRLRAIPIYLAVSALHLVNLWYVYAKAMPGVWKGGLMDFPNLVSLASSFDVLLLIACLAVLVVLMVPGQEHSSARSNGKWEEPCPPTIDSAISLRKASGHGLRARLRDAIRVARCPVTVNVGLLAVALLACLGVGFFAGRMAQPDLGSSLAGGGRTVTVRADRPWQETGVSVQAGQRVSISVRGEWSNQPTGDKYGPKGSGKTDAKAVMPSAPVGVMLGRVGNSAPVAIGEGTTIAATTSGLLQLVMNDWVDGYADNQGSMEATIVVQDSER